MARPARILSIGEVLWDCFGRERRLGGAPFNFGYYAAALGAEAVVVSAVGEDPAGREIRRQARTQAGFALTGRPRWSGRDWAGRRCRSTDGPAAPLGRRRPCALHLQRDQRHPTGLVRVTLDAAGSPTFRILRRRAWDFLAFTPPLGRLAAGADLVCFGTLAQRTPTSRRTIRRALEVAGGLRLCDLNLRPPFVDRRVVEYSLHVADLLKLNEEEFATLREMFGLRGGRLKAARRLMRLFHIDLVCVTMGERGAWLADGAQAVAAPAEPVRVVDAVGAGDAFAASLAVDYLAGKDLAALAANANRLGGLVVSHPGAIVGLDVLDLSRPAV